MKLLEEKIIEEGIVRSEHVLDVSSFLNHQVDAELMSELGKDFANYYKDYDFDAFATVEVSGIAPSVFASLYANKPLIIIKKEYKEKDQDIFTQQEAYSFTKDNKYYLTVKTKFIENKKIVLLDDFLARGSVVLNVEKLLAKVNSTLVSTGICISKNFQIGYKALTEEGYDLYSQAKIKELDVTNNKITFE